MVKTTLRARVALNFLSITIAIIAIALFAPSVLANPLETTDVQKLRSLRVSLHTTTIDITQAMEQLSEANSYSDFRCLNFIHNQAHEIEMTAAGVSDLIALSILMKDSSDELYVLRSLKTWLKLLTNDLLHSRQMINGMMALCPRSATANVKSQVLLNKLSEWYDPVASIVERVERAVSP